MAERDQFARFLGGENPGHARGGEDISLGHCIIHDGRDSGRLQKNGPPRHRLAAGGRFGGDIHHFDLSARIQMGKSLHGRAGWTTLSFHSTTAARICSDKCQFFFTCLGMNSGEMPSKSVVTRISPSQWGPDPMPMVGMEILAVISCATGAATNSSTMPNAPACVKAW